MALLSPETVPVRVYKWDDIGAPVFNKSTNALINIFKACLVTGYGTKPGAGWTAPYEASGIKVFRPQVSADTDFYLRCSANTTTQMTAQVYLNMTGVSAGNLKLQCAQPFKYARGTTTNRWLLVASPRGLWFFCEQAYNLEGVGVSGSYFFAGDTMRDDVGLKSVFMQHTGGVYTDGDYSNIFGLRLGSTATRKDADVYVYGALLDSAGNVHTCDTESLFSGTVRRTTARVLAPLITVANNTIYRLPGVTVPSDGPALLNFDAQKIAMDGYISDIVTFNTGPSVAGNVCVSTNIWSY